jgi:hypothetical protein
LKTKNEVYERIKQRVMQTKARLDRAQREVLNSFGKVACVQQKKKKKKNKGVIKKKKKKKKKLHAYLSISKEEELQIEIQKSVAQS